LPFSPIFTSAVQKRRRGFLFFKMTMNKFVSGFLATLLLTGCAFKSPSPTVSSPKITATAAYVPSDNSAYVVFDSGQDRIFLNNFSIKNKLNNSQVDYLLIFFVVSLSNLDIQKIQNFSLD
jgi:hypothetical protein